MQMKVVYDLQSYTLFLKITPVKEKKAILNSFLMLFLLPVVK